VWVCVCVTFDFLFKNHHILEIVVLDPLEGNRAVCFETQLFKMFLINAITYTYTPKHRSDVNSTVI